MINIMRGEWIADLKNKTCRNINSRITVCFEKYYGLRYMYNPGILFPSFFNIRIFIKCFIAFLAIFQKYIIFGFTI